MINSFRNIYKPVEACSAYTDWGARGGAVVRELASHHCGRVQIPASTPYVGWVKR